MEGVSELPIRREVEAEHEVGDEEGRGESYVDKPGCEEGEWLLNGQRRPAASLLRTLAGSTSTLSSR